MKIEICSKAKALEIAEKTIISTSIISITSLEWEDVIFPDRSNILSVLHLKFNDITTEYDEEGIPYGCPLPKREDLGLYSLQSMAPGSILWKAFSVSLLASH